MHRRSFFATLFGAFCSKFLPNRKELSPPGAVINPEWEEAEYELRPPITDWSGIQFEEDPNPLRYVMTENGWQPVSVEELKSAHPNSEWKSPIEYAKCYPEDNTV